MNRIRVFMLAALLLVLAACNLNSQTQDGAESLMQQGDDSADPSPTATLDDDLFGSPMPTITPSNTLRPPPTFEPPTRTPEPSNTPTITPTPTILIAGNLPALEGLNTATPEPGECEPREDWQLRYEVQPGDAVASIATKYGTYAQDLAEGNCLADMNLVRVGQILRVPGQAHPATPQFDCTWELLTPLNGTITVPGEGTITFNWRGPQTSRYLVRVYNSVDGTGNHILEYMIEYNEYYTMNLRDLPAAGTFSWRVFPLNWEFQQIPCPESYSSRFTKAAAPPTQTTGGGVPTVP